MGNSAPAATSFPTFLSDTSMLGIASGASTQTVGIVTTRPGSTGVLLARNNYRGLRLTPLGVAGAATSSATINLYAVANINRADGSAGNGWMVTGICSNAVTLAQGLAYTALLTAAGTNVGGVSTLHGAQAVTVTVCSAATTIKGSWTDQLTNLGAGSPSPAAFSPAATNAGPAFITVEDLFHYSHVLVECVLGTNTTSLNGIVEWLP